MNAARFNAFGIYYGVAYMALFWLNEFYQISWFGYYPVIGEFRRERLPVETSGPAILWYSWLLGALLISLVLMALTPSSMAERMGRRAVWVVPVAMLIAIFVYERRWFY
jgi:hypothetical protein